MEKLVLVTGASRGIGRAIATQLLELDYKVIAAYKINEKKANEIVSKFKNAFAVQMDISSNESLEIAINKIREYFGALPLYLINNAGIAQEKPFLEISENDLQTMHNVNFNGAFRLCQKLIPTMMEREFGRIINITSIGGQWGGFNQVHYAASKAALINLTQSIAKIYSGYGITSNAVSPGLVGTGMAIEEIKRNDGKNKIKNIPVGRIAFPEEIASIVSFLCSNEASYITGQTINANGGMFFG